MHFFLHSILYELFVVSTRSWTHGKLPAPCPVPSNLFSCQGGDKVFSEFHLFCLDLWLLPAFFSPLRTYCFVIFSLDFYINWLSKHLSTICSTCIIIKSVLTFSYDIVYNAHLFISTVIKYDETHHDSSMQSTVDREVLLSFAWAVVVLPESFCSVSPYLCHCCFFFFLDWTIGACFHDTNTSMSLFHTLYHIFKRLFFINFTFFSFKLRKHMVLVFNFNYLFDSVEYLLHVNRSFSYAWVITSTISLLTDLILPIIIISCILHLHFLVAIFLYFYTILWNCFQYHYKIYPYIVVIWYCN